MRWRILRALLDKEIARYLANRGGLALAMLLIVATILLSVFNPTQAGDESGGVGTFAGIGGIHHCFVDSTIKGPWLDHLKANPPLELPGQLLFRAPDDKALGVVFIMIRPMETPGSQPRVQVQFVAPAGNTAMLAPYEAWFWRETRRFMLGQTSTGTAPQTGDLWIANAAFQQLYDDAIQKDERNRVRLPLLQFERIELDAMKLVDPRLVILMSMIVFSFFFSCIYLLPAFTCEERERGVLLAQALSPASPLEMLVAKAMFYPVIGFILAIILVGIYRFSLLSQPFLWLAFGAISIAFLGIGLTIACIVKTTRGASMGAMMYTLSVALLILICQQNNLAFIAIVFVEYHGPKIVHAAISAEVGRVDWLHLLAAWILAIAWCAVAVRMFRRQGWQ